MCNQDSPDTLFQEMCSPNFEGEGPPFSSLCMDADSVRELLWIAYRASMQPEEGRNPSLVLLVPEAPLEDDFGVWFEPPVDLNDGVVRRLAAGVPGRPHCLVVHERTQGIPAAAGVWRAERVGRFHLSPNEVSPAFFCPGLFIEIRGPGHLVVTDRSRDIYQTFELKACSLRTMWDVTERGAGRRVVERFAEQFLTSTVAPVHFEDARAVGRLLLAATLHRAVDLGHGGAFVVAPFESVQCHLRGHIVCEDHGPGERNAWQMLLSDRERNADAHVAQDHALTQQRLVDLPGVVGQLSAVDGAVILNPSLGVRALAAEITLGSDPIPRCVEHNHRDEPGEDFPIDQRGTRNRSAARLCARVPEATVFLVSQDRDLVVYERDDAGYVRVYRTLGLIAGASATS